GNVQKYAQGIYFSAQYQVGNADDLTHVPPIQMSHYFAEIRGNQIQRSYGARDLIGDSYADSDPRSLNANDTAGSGIFLQSLLVPSTTTTIVERMGFGLTIAHNQLSEVALKQADLNGEPMMIAVSAGGSTSQPATPGYVDTLVFANVLHSPDQTS